MEKGKILLSNLIQLNPREFKVHFAKRNYEGVEPLDVFLEGEDKWKDWQSYRPKKNDFNRKYIFSLMRYYPSGTDDFWLFGGVWEVKGQKNGKYIIATTDIGKEFIGRLVVEYKFGLRNIRVNFEKHYESIIVSEILSDSYAGDVFPGLNNINIDFKSLETHFKKNHNSWKDVLSKFDGVYLITDKKTGKRYVGIAHSGQGIWARWHKYIQTGHGNNKKLRMLVKEKGIHYAKDNFKFSLLEIYQFGTREETIHARETHWKNVLMTRDDRFGYNEN